MSILVGPDRLFPFVAVLTLKGIVGRICIDVGRPYFSLRGKHRDVDDTFYAEIKRWREIISSDGLFYSSQ